MFERENCEFKYNTDAPSLRGIACSYLITLFAIFLELAVHSSLSCCNTTGHGSDNNTSSTTNVPSHGVSTPVVVNEQPQLQVPPALNATQAELLADAQELEESEKKSEVTSGSCVANPSPNIRANRLIFAFLLYTVVLSAFIVRIHEIDDPYISPECRRYVWKGSIPGPNWFAVVLTNIIPFIAATFSMIRTVVDCWLVRSGRGLTYVGQSGGEDWTTWPPCMPFFLLFVGVRQAFTWPIALLMNRPPISTGERYAILATVDGDIEMQGEEARRLIDDHSGDGSDYEGDNIDPPAYNDTIHNQGDVRKM
ncbi:hypothetical protein G6514_004277 [Epicoccum nigrum]|nr:hypothetical protein G6514_004277 [Epicoccum nigrum]